MIPVELWDVVGDGSRLLSIGTEFFMVVKDIPMITLLILNKCTSSLPTLRIGSYQD